MSERQDANLHALLMRELHHRFANSLQLLSSTVGALTRSRARAEDFEDLQSRIGSLGFVHRRLSELEHHGSDLFDLARELCPLLAASFGRSDLHFTGKGTCPTDNPMAVRGLALILVELVTNALKHGQRDCPVELGIVSNRRQVQMTASNTVVSGREVNRPKVAAALAEALGGSLRVERTPLALVTVVVPYETSGCSGVALRETT